MVDHVPFLLLGLDLPPAPLFKDALEKVIIPQVLHTVLHLVLHMVLYWVCSCSTLAVTAHGAQAPVLLEVWRTV